MSRIAFGVSLLTTSRLLICIYQIIEVILLYFKLTETNVFIRGVSVRYQTCWIDGIPGSNRDPVA